METVKVQDLPREVQQKLGYLAPDVPQKAGEVAARGNTATTAGPVAEGKGYGLGPIIPWVKDACSRFKPLFSNAQIQRIKEQLESRGGTPNLASINPTIIYAALGIAFIVFLFFSLCSRMICQKAGAEPGVLIWLPVLQMIPLFRAAGMSPAWLLAYFVPFLNLVAQIMWSLNIAKARNKSVGVGILLLLPILNVFAFLYLAFSDSGSDSAKPAKKQGSRVLVLGAT